MVPSMSRILIRRSTLFLISIYCLISFGACANYTTQQGVQNKWRDESLPQVQVGKTTQAEVAKQFGPPSQVIALNDQVIFYYLLEQKKGKGAFFIIYNWLDNKTTYDRAIFFFNNKGILIDYAYSLEKVAYEE